MQRKWYHYAIAPTSLFTSLQPLDRSVYGPLKKHVNSACDSWILSHPGKSMSIYDIPAIVASCLPRDPSNVIAGFKVTGINTESDFAPGLTTADCEGTC